jgi:hypothetical protein
MAKMFYTLDETRAALGQSEDQIKTLTREGRLREFRDGPRLMFKADQVDALKSQITSDPLSLAEESGAPLSLADTGGGTGMNSLADSISSGVSSGSGLASISGSGLGSGIGSGVGSGVAGGSPGSGMMNLRDDTALAADLGLSGTGLAGSVDSMGGMPSPIRSSGGSLGGSIGGLGSGLGGSGLGGTSAGTAAGTTAGSVAGASSGGSRQGVNVFGEESHFAVDPMAQTAAPGLGGADLNLEGVGSGSGLLDLTRETDDTSLGAEIIDEIAPSRGGRPMGPSDTGSMAGVGLESPRGGVVRGGMGVQVVAAHDPWATAFGAFALGAAIVVLFGGFALLTSMYGVQPPELVAYFKDKTFLVIAAFGAGIAAVFGAFGKLISVSTGR